MTTKLQPTEFDEVERYELREPAMYRFDTDRRQFVQTLGAGFVIAVAVRPSLAQRRGGRRRARRNETLTERFHFGPDGLVTILTSKVEVGQGSRTQITQAAAEELRLPADQIRLTMADTQLCPDDGGTAGSRTTPSAVPQIRQAAAGLREVMLDFAARQLDVDRSAMKYSGGIFSAAGGQRISFADLIRKDEFLSQLDSAPPEGVSVTRMENWQVMGKPLDKVNGKDVVTGAARYPSDIVRPNMLYGAVLRPTSYGATLTSADTAEAAAMDGVTVVRDGNFVGCAAPNSWQAQNAVAAIAKVAVWQRPPHRSSDELYSHLKESASQEGNGWNRPRTNTWGSGVADLPASEKQLEASYTIAYLQHAPMEPRAAVAEWKDGKLTVWTGTQQPSRVHGELRQTFQLPEDGVRVIVPDTGGGFGGKHTGEAAVEAARLAKAARRPVSLRWTREEEFTWAYFRPAGLIELRAALNDRGRIEYWDFANYNSGGSAIETPYTVPNGRTRFLGAEAPLRQGSYRALASTANTFARESAMDELAALTGIDPLAFRLQHLEPGRLKNVLQAAAQKFGWTARRKSPGRDRGVGLGCGTEKGSYVAACAEVEVVDGRIKVLSVCQAYECGAIHHPSNLRSQVEGCLIMGLGGALTEEIEFRDGRITNPTFSSYVVPHMADVPTLDIVLVDRSDLPSVGAGETPIIAVAPAIANAIHQAAGKRCRAMPLRV